MDNSVREVAVQGWRVLVTLLVPSIAIPVAGGLFSLALGFLGIRDEGLSYAVKVLALIGVGVLILSSVSTALVELMVLALR
jgi:type III secretory pathway component EscS